MSCIAEHRDSKKGGGGPDNLIKDFVTQRALQVCRPFPVTICGICHCRPLPKALADSPGDFSRIQTLLVNLGNSHEGPKIQFLENFLHHEGCTSFLSPAHPRFAPLLFSWRPPFRPLAYAEAIAPPFTIF
jgi:hypothetical protein